MQKYDESWHATRGEDAIRRETYRSHRDAS